MAFDGKASYDDFSLIGEDISSTLLLISPTETPFLDLLTPPLEPATNVLHSWTEEELNPDRLINSTAIPNSTAGTQSPVQVNGFGGNVTVGMVVEMEGTTEVCQISSIVGVNSIVLLRGFGGSTVSSLAPGGNLFVVAGAELEGSETAGDINRTRARGLNYTQIFKKPILVSGTDRAVRYAPDIGDEFDHQTTLRSIEAAKELEKAVFRSVLSGNSIGSDTTYRTMRGLKSFFTAINSTIVHNSFVADPLGYTNDLLQNIWNTGARDVDVIVCGADWKRALSNTNAAKLVIQQGDRGIDRRLEYISTDFGTARLVLTPWLPNQHLMAVSSRRIKVVPLRGRFFAREVLAKTGDSTKGHVLGEYSLEVHHASKMGQAHS